MKNHLFYLIIVLNIFLLTGCSSGKRSLEKGNYYKATLEAVKQLRSSPNNKKAASVIVRSYPLAKQKALTDIGNAMAMNSSDKFSLAVDNYTALNQLADAIMSSPKALQLIGNPTNYAKELGEMLPKAAGEKYNQGTDLLKTGNRTNAREAYFAFLKANEYVKGFRDVNQKIEESLNLATLKVVVEKPKMPQRFQFSSDFFYDNLMNELSRFEKNRFVKFYTWKETGEGNLIKPDEFMVLDFEDFSVGNVRETRDHYEAVKDSVIVGRIQQNGETVNVYGTVKAKVSLVRQEVLSQGILSVKVVNSNNTRILDSKKFPGQFIWENQWLTYNGDERALNDEELKLSMGRPLLPPAAQDLFIEFTKPIFSQTLDYLKRTYSAY